MKKVKNSEVLEEIKKLDAELKTYQSELSNEVALNDSLSKQIDKIV